MTHKTIYNACKHIITVNTDIQKKDLEYTHTHTHTHIISYTNDMFVHVKPFLHDVTKVKVKINIILYQIHEFNKDVNHFY